MAKISVSGSAAVLTSALKLTDIEMVAKYSPKSLVLIEDEKPVFKVSVGGAGEAGSLQKFGATFAPNTTNSQGLAQITLGFDPATENVKEYLADKYGNEITHLTAVEKAVNEELLNSIKTAHEELLNSITVG